jgi:hypothetical protein
MKHRRHASTRSLLIVDFSANPCLFTLVVLGIYCATRNNTAVLTKMLEFFYLGHPAVLIQLCNNNNNKTLTHHRMYLYWHTIPFVLICVFSYFMFRLGRAIIRYLYIKKQAETCSNLARILE